MESKQTKARRLIKVWVHQWLKCILYIQCDKVPEDIDYLLTQIYLDWLDQLTLETLAEQPDWVMEKRFLDTSGKPDRTKTSCVSHCPV